jgi:hypothetical protein
MNSDKNTPRLLGAAFLLQAVASAVSGLILLEPLILPGNIIDSMTNISNNVMQMRASVVVEMITAIGIVMLGVLLYVTLKKQNMKILSLPWDCILWKQQCLLSAELRLSLSYA